MTPTYPMTACAWLIGAIHEWGDVRVNSMVQRDGSKLYAVRMRGWTANKDGEWEYEPLPSSRDDGYIARCRWDDRAAAMDTLFSVSQAAASTLTSVVRGSVLR